MIFNRIQIYMISNSIIKISTEIYQNRLISFWMRMWADLQLQNYTFFNLTKIHIFLIFNENNSTYFSYF